MKSRASSAMSTASLSNTSASLMTQEREERVRRNCFYNQKIVPTLNNNDNNSKKKIKSPSSSQSQSQSQSQSSSSSHKSNIIQNEKVAFASSPSSLLSKQKKLIENSNSNKKEEKNKYNGSNTGNRTDNDDGIGVTEETSAVSAVRGTVQFSPPRASLTPTSKSLPSLLKLSTKQRQHFSGDSSQKHHTKDDNKKSDSNNNNIDTKMVDVYSAAVDNTVLSSAQMPSSSVAVFSSLNRRELVVDSGGKNETNNGIIHSEIAMVLEKTSNAAPNSNENNDNNNQNNGDDSDDDSDDSSIEEVTNIVDDMNDKDILYGSKEFSRKPNIRDHPGNKVYRETVRKFKSHLQEDNNTSDNRNKIAKDVINYIYNVIGGRFLKKVERSSNQWYIVPRKDAVKKVSLALMGLKRGTKVKTTSNSTSSSSSSSSSPPPPPILANAKDGVIIEHASSTHKDVTIARYPASSTKPTAVEPVPAAAVVAAASLKSPFVATTEETVITAPALTMGSTKGGKKIVIELLDDSSDDDDNKRSNGAAIEGHNDSIPLASLSSPNSETNDSRRRRSRQEGKVAFNSKRQKGNSQNKKHSLDLPSLAANNIIEILDDDDDNNNNYDNKGNIGTDSQHTVTKSTKNDSRAPTQCKEPPSLAPQDLKVCKESIQTISQRMQDEKYEMKKQILERAFKQQQNTCNQKLMSNKTQIYSSRFKKVTEKLTYTDENNLLGSIEEGQPTLVNSTMTVVPTENDDDDDDDDNDNEEKKIRKKAKELQLKPHQYKDLKETFAAILDELPIAKHKYHPSVHDYISRMLYPRHAPCGQGEEVILDVPLQYEKAPSVVENPKIIKNETKDTYESVMKSFRDVCPQCKTFDCSLHFQNYPDAGTQAAVAIQYDKLYLRRQKREEQQHQNDPFSSIIINSSSGNTTLKEGVSDDTDNSMKFVIIEPRKCSISSRCSKRTYIFGRNITCPFCKFSCKDGEKLSKHLLRYHQDEYLCNEIDKTVTVTTRRKADNKKSNNFKPKQLYYHSRNLIPYGDAEDHERDSDDESDYSWYHEYRHELLSDINDISQEDKKLQSMWNRFVGCSPIPIPNKDLPKLCFYFLQKHKKELEGLEWLLIKMLIVFWERHLLRAVHVQKLLHLYHFKKATKIADDEEKLPLNKDQIFVVSRLYIIFESLCGHGRDTLSLLRDATKRNNLEGKDLVETPVAEVCNWSKDYVKKRKNVQFGNRFQKFFYPCHHAGACSMKTCSCMQAGYVCTKDCIWGEYGANYFAGCSCTTDCRTTKWLCPCRDANRECDPDVCKCCVRCDDGGCSNMDVTMARRVPLFVGKSSIKGAGFGLFTKNALKRGQYIDEYIGELVKEEGSTTVYYFDHSEDYAMDASRQGNKTRYLNHSKAPNLECRSHFMNGEKRIPFYAKQDIPAQSELFYSYGKKYNNIWRSLGIEHLCVDSSDDELQTTDL